MMNARQDPRRPSSAGPTQCPRLLALRGLVKAPEAHRRHTRARTHFKKIILINDFICVRCLRLLGVYPGLL